MSSIRPGAGADGSIAPHASTAAARALARRCRASNQGSGSGAPSSGGGTRPLAIASDAASRSAGGTTWRAPVTASRTSIPPSLRALSTTPGRRMRVVAAAISLDLIGASGNGAKFFGPGADISCTGATHARAASDTKPTQETIP